jgi:hypothetical protein
VQAILTTRLVDLQHDTVRRAVLLVGVPGRDVASSHMSGKVAEDESSIRVNVARPRCVQ